MLVFDSCFFPLPLPVSSARAVSFLLLFFYGDNGGIKKKLLQQSSPVLGRTGRPIGVSSCFRVFLRLLKSWQWRQPIIYNRSEAGVTANRPNWPRVVEGTNCFKRKSPLYLVHHWDEVQCLPTFRENLQHGLLKTFSVDSRKLYNECLWDYFFKFHSHSMRRLRKDHQLWFVWNKCQLLF